MLSFSTEFPLGDGSTPDAFLATVKSWALASPHTTFNRAGLELLAIGREKMVRAGNAELELAGGVDQSEAAISVRHTVRDGDVDWITEISFANAGQPWASVRTFRDSSSPVAHLPPAKKPVIVMTLLDALGGGADGELPVSRAAHLLRNDDISLAGRLITGDAGCYLPVVYVSAPFDGSGYLDHGVLARDLCGMAHVVVEPNRPFSQRLQLEVSSNNAYGGAIGIYWPDGAGRHFILPNYNLSLTERRQAVTRAVRAALLNRRPLQWCSWIAAQQISSRLAIKELRSSGSDEVEVYISTFDAEIALKNKQIKDAEDEIQRLHAELGKATRSKADQSGIHLKVASEQEYFPGEISGVVRDAVAEAVSRVQLGSRREHILRAVAASNVPRETSSEGRDRLKSILRGYKTMSKEVRDGLLELGFSITEDGKHYKLVYRSDGRYVFSMPKTSSDHRAGLNLASDIAKRIF